jgi:hypothetical protein
VRYDAIQSATATPGFRSGPRTASIPFPFGEQHGPRTPSIAGGARRQRLTLFPLPGRHARVPTTESLGKDLLRQREIHPTLADALTQRSGGIRMTSWEFKRSTADEAEIAERQRNGAPAAGSDTPFAAVAAGPPRSRNTPRE